MQRNRYQQTEDHCPYCSPRISQAKALSPNQYDGVGGISSKRDDVRRQRAYLSKTARPKLADHRCCRYGAEKRLGFHGFHHASIRHVVRHVSMRMLLSGSGSLSRQSRLRIFCQQLVCCRNGSRGFKRRHGLGSNWPEFIHASPALRPYHGRSVLDLAAGLPLGEIAWRIEPPRDQVTQSTKVRFRESPRQKAISYSPISSS